jgi:pimeloyl-ACP methyl ester carboxylesterase
MMATSTEIAVTRQDFFLASDAGINLAVREVRAEPLQGEPPAVILLHGARVPGIPSFDLPIPHGSLAADVAAAGYRVFIMDARGYGGSTRIGQDGDTTGEPLVRSDEVARDIDAVINEIKARMGVSGVALMGWATGGHWVGMYASRHPQEASHVIIYNSLYGGHAGHNILGSGGPLSDPDDPTRFDIRKSGAFGFSTAASLTPSWDASIPVEDKTTWRDPQLLEAYQSGALASDPTSNQRVPPSFRAPMGAMADSFELASGRKLWDAATIAARVHIIRSGKDFWSRPEDLLDLQHDLVRARSVRAVTIPEATHYLHLDRPQRGRDSLMREVVGFLAEP